MRRRSFLGAAGLGAATLLLPRRARAADRFGEFPSAQASLALPSERRVSSVLEIYLYGGLSPWETLYFNDAMGLASNTFYHAYDSSSFGDSHPEAFAACDGVAGAIGADLAPSFFAQDAAGRDVFLGPYAFALRERPDLIERLRIVTMGHELLPHEAAVPFAVTGKRVGQPSLAGLGAHVQRFFQERDDGSRRAPFSYVLANGGAIPSDNTAALFATGTHPGSARPLRINVDVVQQLSVLLDRAGIADKERHDALVDLYVQKQRARLSFGGTPLRSKRFAELDAAARATRAAADVKTLLEPTLTPLPVDEFCASGPRNNVPARSLEIAAHLLKHPDEPARYVCVVDTGLIPADGGGGYDTHAVQCLPTMTNFTNIIRALSRVVNAPGENDPAKIDLDDTLVLLNTEFGRTPTIQEGIGGRNHHPAGYVTALLGGPITSRGLLGAIDDDATATQFLHPAETRMAALLSLGIFPFSGDSFFLSDVPGTSEEPEAIDKITRDLLGVSL